MMIILLILTALVATPITTFALPTTSNIVARACDVSKARLPSLPGPDGGFPSTLPGLQPVDVAIGSGIVNYNCIKNKYM
jgi:hypothetical protein